MGICEIFFMDEFVVKEYKVQNVSILCKINFFANELFQKVKGPFDFLYDSNHVWLLISVRAMYDFAVAVYTQRVVYNMVFRG